MDIRNRHSKSGGVLIATLIICGLVGIMLVAYLSMVSNQHKMSQRSQVWNNCIPMCEVGIEEALAHLNHINTTNNFAINGWTSNAGNFFSKSRLLNGGRANIVISNTSPPTIMVMASLRSPAQSGNITRRVLVKTRINQKFPNGILCKGGVRLLGASGRVDSFNPDFPGVESDPNGLYALPYATANASVVTTANTANIIDVGNLKVYGSIGMGPGGTASLGPNGNVGDKAWNDNPANNGTIQPGHTTDDVNVYIPDATFPTDFSLTAGPPSPGLVGITPYNYILGHGDYRMMSLNLLLGQSMIVTGKARIYIQSTTTVSSSITITTNGSVEWYCGGNANFGGSGVINGTGRAKNFSIIGLRPCTSVIYGGSTKFVGTVYAPWAATSISGSAEAMGAVVARTFVFNGSIGFHYDESLKGDPKKNRFIAASWQEL